MPAVPMTYASERAAGVSMSYSIRLEEKIDTVVKGWKGVGKKMMFGGVCYLLRGNMCFGIWKDALIVRMDKEQAEKSLALRNVLPFDITGRPMAGWVMVEEAGWKSTAGLAKWVGIGKKFAMSLPEKKAKTKKKKLMEYKVR
jgi:TfoX/Sxy family transcriptional regulator of competence genes